MLRVLDLFSGIGGFSLGLERTGGFKTVAFCEIEPYCRAVLKKHWPDVPCFEDVRKLQSLHVGPIDVVCGGFPCQPSSRAGKRMGKKDDRWLWPDCARILQESAADWFVGENVIGLADMELDNVLADLEDIGYQTRTFDIPACALGANHERRRLWIVAHSNRKGLQGGKDNIRSLGKWPHRIQLSAGFSPIKVWLEGAASWYGGSLNGIPRGVDRIKAIGNAVVPQIPEIIGRAILEAEGMK